MCCNAGAAPSFVACERLATTGQVEQVTAGAVRSVKAVGETEEMEEEALLRGSFSF